MPRTRRSYPVLSKNEIVGLTAGHVSPGISDLPALGIAPAIPLIVPMTPVTAPRTDNQEASGIAASIRSALLSTSAVHAEPQRNPAAH